MKKLVALFLVALLLVPMVAAAQGPEPAKRYIFELTPEEWAKIIRADEGQRPSIEFSLAAEDQPAMPWWMNACRDIGKAGSVLDTGLSFAALRLNGKKWTEMNGFYDQMKPGAYFALSAVFVLLPDILIKAVYKAGPNGRAAAGVIAVLWAAVEVYVCARNIDWIMGR